MNKSKDVEKVAIYGILGNILLLIAKLIVGFTARSQAMIADGLNSGGDVFASFMTYIGNKISEKPGDEDHPYGHGKAEYIYSMIISFSLLLVAFSIFSSSLNAIINKELITYSPFLIIVALFTIFLKLILYMYANKIGKRYNSLLAISNAVDHRNDILLTSLTLFSIILSIFNVYIVDGIVGIIIAFWIAYSGFSIFSDSYVVLMDTNINEQIKKEMEERIEKINGVDHLDTIHAQPTGLRFLLIVKVSIDANLTVYEGHSISATIKEELMNFENIADVIVHVNPAQYHKNNRSL